ncbi:MAG: homoserine kinase [Chloroflexota bacterium]
MSGGASGSDLVGRTVSVDVPATSANLGAGFDALALALDLRSLIHLEVVAPDSEPEVLVSIDGEGAGHLPAGKRNRFIVALLEGLAAGGLAEPELGWRVHMENNIPVARGLGSSASAVVAALVAADDLLGDKLGPERILELAAASEGHADNAAAAIYGGLCVVADVEGRPRAVRIEPPARLHAAMFIPDKPLSTAAMRAALPESVPFADAVHNIGAAALAVAALGQDRLELLDAATADRLHEPYRAQAYPELPELIAAARSAGALGACLSGAGSTVIAFSDDASAAASIAAAMQERAVSLGLVGRSAVQRARSAGAHVIASSSAQPVGSAAGLA